MPTPRNWDQAAADVWPALVGAAAQRKLLTYGELSPIARPNPLSVGRALGPIQTHCLEARLPPLTAIVIGKTTRVPGGGFIAWDVDDLDEAFEAVFRFDWSGLDNPFNAFVKGATEASLASRLLTDPDSADQVYGLVKVRGVAQRIFRRALLESYTSCCMCGLSFEAALEAAHIVPWSDCEPHERMDVRNGVLLCSNHHGMFDAGLLSITSDYTIEYYDPTAEDGEYSRMDDAHSAALHGKPIALPRRVSLRPSRSAIQRLRALDDWD